MVETEKRKSDLQEILTVAIIVISCFFVITYFLTTVIGPAIFFFTKEGVETSVTPMKYGILVWIFVVIFFYVPITPTHGEVFACIVAIFFLCFLAAWMFRERFHKVIKKSSSYPISKLFSNFLVVMPIITSMLLTAVIAIISLQTAVGFPTTPPKEMEEQTPLMQLFSASYAAIIEEIGFRISPIGLFVIIDVFVARVRNGITLSGVERLKLFFKALIYPDKAKKTVGLKTVGDFGVRGGIGQGEWITIFLTALVWAALHFVIGGWTVGKITSVFVDGLVFGLVYLVYGAYAPILLHWFFNYYLSILSSDLSLIYYPYLLPISDLAVLLMLGVGIVGWIAFAIIGVKKLLKLRAKPSQPLPLPPPPPPLPPPPPD